MAAYRRKDGKPLAADETVVLVELKGFEYCKLPTLARTLDISANQMREVLQLCTSMKAEIARHRVEMDGLRSKVRTLMAGQRTIAR